MIKNIALLCNKNGFAKQVAAEMSKQLDMNFFDTMDMLAFEDKPRTLAETLEILGEEPVHRHEAKIIKFATDFSNAIIVCESGAVEHSKNIDRLAECALIVYLHCSVTSVLNNNQKGHFASEKERDFYVKSAEQYSERTKLSKKAANITVCVTGKSPFVAAALTIKAISEWSKKNF